MGASIQFQVLSFITYDLWASYWVCISLLIPNMQVIIVSTLEFQVGIWWHKSGVFYVVIYYYY